jgi:hypothetical protein
LDDTSQQLDSGTAGEKKILYTGVIVLIDNIDRDKQLQTADSLESPIAITLSFYSSFTIGNQFTLSCLITNLKHLSAQTTPCAVRFGIEEYQSTNCF